MTEGLRPIEQNDKSNLLSSRILGVIANNPKCHFYGVIAESKMYLKEGFRIDKYSNNSYDINNTWIKDYTEEKIRNIYLAIMFTKNEYSPLTENFYYMTKYNNEHNLSNIYSEEYKDTKWLIIENKDIDEIKKWYHLLKQVTNKQINIAINNLKHAVIDGKPYEDSMMFAFCSWEGMFTSNIKTTKTVTNSISKCSNIKYSRIKSLYKDYRCGKFHGRKIDCYKDNVWKEVVDITMSCCEKILLNNHLWNLSPEERANHFNKKAK